MHERKHEHSGASLRGAKLFFVIAENMKSPEGGSLEIEGLDGRQLPHKVRSRPTLGTPFHITLPSRVKYDLRLHRPGRRHETQVGVTPLNGLSKHDVLGHNSPRAAKQGLIVNGAGQFY
jgi:hypothetical protein